MFNKHLLKQGKMYRIYRDCRTSPRQYLLMGQPEKGSRTHWPVPTNCLLLSEKGQEVAVLVPRIKKRKGKDKLTRGLSPLWWGWTPPSPGPQHHCSHQAAVHSAAWAPGSPSAQRLTDSAHRHKGLDGLGASFPACSATFWSSPFPAKEGETD